MCEDSPGGVSDSPRFLGATAVAAVFWVALLLGGSFVRLAVAQGTGLSSAPESGKGQEAPKPQAAPEDGDKAREGKPQPLESPLKAVGGVRIGFVPPPMEGTISLGVYDLRGRLVRALRTEADESGFGAGLNGFVLSWDGLNDAGVPVSTGKYRVKGVAVGDLEVSGEAYHGNDWMDAEGGVRPVVFRRIRLEGDNLEVIAADREGRWWRLSQPLPEGDLKVERFGEGASVSGALNLPDAGGQAGASGTSGASTTGSAPSVPSAVEEGPVSCAGRAGSVWVIEKGAREKVVVQKGADGSVLGRLSVGVGQPAPVGVAASPEREEVFLLENEGDWWRVRGLRRKKAAAKKGPSKEGDAGWETFFERNRWPCSKFVEVAARVGREKPFVAEKSVAVKTLANPLFAGASSGVSVGVGFDAEGSYLKTADGLVLRRLTETKQLLWAVLGRDAGQRALVLLQSDGTAVEEYWIRRPEMMMGFDAGEYPFNQK